MEEELKEVFIDYRNGFVEVLVPASERLKNHFAELNVQLPEGFETEINLEAINWLKEVSLILEKGFVK